MVKCNYWDSPISLDGAVNKGTPQGSFTVAIAGSNGYITHQVSTPAGFQAGQSYGNCTISAPLDAQGSNTVCKL